MLNSRIKNLTRQGFTLIEMIISVALVLVLMLAITKIFSITGAAVGAAQGLGAATRDARAAQTVFAHDIASIASDSPFIYIRYNGLQPAFRNKIDEESDTLYSGAFNATTGMASSNQNPNILSLDLNDNGVFGESTVPGEAIGMYTANFRNHRQDRFSFCARDRFYRETGNTANNTLVDDLSSPEAWITYEHLDLPYSNGQFYLTGNKSSGNLTHAGIGTAQTNPQNFYASQWVLGRVAELMVLPTGAPSSNSANEYIKDTAGVNQEYYRRGGVSGASWIYTQGMQSYPMTPLSDASSASVKDSAGNTIEQEDTRYDLVGIDIANARDVITHYGMSAAATPWYANMLAERFRVNPFIVKPINAANASQQVPIFLPACSQFIVEYAGDFVSQTSGGATPGSIDTTAPNTGLSPDGQIDFTMVNGVRQIQWYGLPRSPAGNATISPANGDVVTVGDFVHYLTGTYISSTSTYKTYSDLTNKSFDDWERVAAATNLNDSYTGTGPALPSPFYAAWGPTDTNRPKLYRITLVIDRPEMAGRTLDGETFQYIFNAP